MITTKDICKMLGVEENEEFRFLDYGGLGYRVSNECLETWYHEDC